MAHVPVGATGRRSPTWTDIVLAAGVLAVDLGGALITAHRDGEPRLSALGVVYLVATAVPLIWRRMWPTAVCAAVGLASAAFGIAELPDPPVQVAFLVAIFTVAMYEPRRRTVIVVLVAVISAGVSIVLAGDSG